MKIFSTLGNAYYKPYHGSDHCKNAAQTTPHCIDAIVYSFSRQSKIQRKPVYSRLVVMIPKDLVLKHRQSKFYIKYS